MYEGFGGVYAAGVFDYCLDNGISFDMSFGVSDGAFNIMAYASRQKGRNLFYYSEYGLIKEYASFHNFICKKSFIDLYVYSTLTNSDGEYPLDYKTLINNPMELTIVASRSSLFYQS